MSISYLTRKVNVNQSVALEIARIGYKSTTTGFILPHSF